MGEECCAPGCTASPIPYLQELYVGLLTCPLHPHFLVVLSLSIYIAVNKGYRIFVNILFT